MRYAHNFSVSLKSGYKKTYTILQHYYHPNYHYPKKEKKSLSILEPLKDIHSTLPSQDFPSSTHFMVLIASINTI